MSSPRQESVPWNTDDVQTLLHENLGPSFEEPAAKQLFGCYGVGIIGLEDTGEIVVTVAGPPPQDRDDIYAYWSVVSRFDTKGLSDQAVQLAVNNLQQLAYGIIHLKYAGWQITNDKTKVLPLKRKKIGRKPRGSFCIKVTNEKTEATVYSCNVRMCSQNKWKKTLAELTSDLADFKHIDINAKPKAISRFDNVVLEQQPVAHLLMAIQPDIDGQQLEKISQMAQAQIQDSNQPVVETLQRLLQDAGAVQQLAPTASATQQ